MHSSVAAVGLAGLVGLFACESSSSGGDGAPGRPSSASSAAVATSSTAAISAPVAPSSSASAASAPRLETIVAQHILVGYKGAKRIARSVVRSKPEAKARAEEALAKIRAGAEFEDMVKEYSDDPGSIDRRGLLGKFHRQDLDPAFSAAAFALTVEQVSDVVETPFGFHIIKRTQ